MLTHPHQPVVLAGVLLDELQAVVLSKQHKPIHRPACPHPSSLHGAWWGPTTGSPSTPGTLSVLLGGGGGRGEEDSAVGMWGEGGTGRGRVGPGAPLQWVVVEVKPVMATDTLSILFPSLQTSSSSSTLIHILFPLLHY